jgi:integrase
VYKTIIIKHEDGERLPCLVDDMGMPLILQNEYIMKKRGLGWGTLDKYLRILGYVCEWEYKNIDIFQRISEGKFLTESELTGSLLPHLRKDFSNTKVVKNLVVSADTYNSRLLLLNKYIGSLFKKKLFSMDIDNSEFLVVDSLSKHAFNLIKEAELSTPGENKKDKGITTTQLDFLLDIIHPYSPQNPFSVNSVKIRNYIIIMVEILCGVRPSELLGVKIDDIEFGAMCAIHIIRRPHDPEDPRIGNPEVKRLGRTFILSDAKFMMEINDYIGNEREKLMDKYPDKETDFVFYSQHGNPIGNRAVSNIYVKIRDKFPDIFDSNFTAKSLRHVYSSSLETRMRKAGVPKEERQKILQYMRGDESEDSQNIYLNQAIIEEVHKYSAQHQKDIFSYAELACF